MLSNKNWGFGLSKLAIVLRLLGHQPACGRWWAIAFASLGVFPLLFPSLQLPSSQATSFLAFALPVLSPNLLGGGVSKWLGGCPVVVGWPWPTSGKKRVLEWRKYKSCRIRRDSVHCSYVKKKKNTNKTTNFLKIIISFNKWASTDCTEIRPPANKVLQLNCNLLTLWHPLILVPSTQAIFINS